MGLATSTLCAHIAQNFCASRQTYASLVYEDQSLLQEIWPDLENRPVQEETHG